MKLKVESVYAFRWALSQDCSIKDCSSNFYQVMLHLAMLHLVFVYLQNSFFMNQTDKLFNIFGSRYEMCDLSPLDSQTN